MTKFSKKVENTVGKGEIARYDQFLFFPHSVFKRVTLQTRKNKGLFRDSLSPIRQIMLNFYFLCFSAKWMNFSHKYSNQVCQVFDMYNDHKYFTHFL